MNARKDDYELFLDTKRITAPHSGFGIAPSSINPMLHDWQQVLVRWALHKGCAALFEDTGLGKSPQQLEWGRIVCQFTGGNVLILTTLAVAKQTVREGMKFGIPVNLCRSQDDVKPGNNITNYERLHLFDLSQFAGVVLDESSVLKNFEGKTRSALIESCRGVPYKLCCTATPAPNDISELANHAEFLGIMSRVEMLATFFVHDDDGWRLKGHAAQAFYRWLATWSAWVKKPSDLGYSDTGYILPRLSIHPVYVGTDYAPDGALFAAGLSGVTDRAKVRKATLSDRVRAAVEIVASEPSEAWIVWTGLNDEAEQMAKALAGLGAVNVHGTLSPEEKETYLEAFADRSLSILVSKPSICGFGMNYQHCARQIFVGLSDSYESYYQCLRRSYRYGQTRPVDAYIVLSEIESGIHANVLSKEREAEQANAALVKYMKTLGSGRFDESFDADAEPMYQPNRPMTLPKWMAN